jgi:hypothetical protein
LEAASEGCGGEVMRKMPMSRVPRAMTLKRDE